MGNYNPSVPIILGQEWVPIRNENTIFSPAVNVVELGHKFTALAPRQVADARYTINQFPQSLAIGQQIGAAIYPAGTEDQTGPIQSVTIPVSFGSITGTGISLSGASSVADALLSNADAKSLLFDTNFAGAVNIFFGTNSYPVLSGKRIVGVNLKYVAYGVEAFPPFFMSIFQQNDAGQYVYFGDLDGDLDLPGPTRTKVLGETTGFWSTTTGPWNTTTRLPWRYTELQRWEASSAARFFIHIEHTAGQFTPAVTATLLRYMALEVFYCEEKRIAYGARVFGQDNAGGPPSVNYVLGTNIIPMYDTNYNPTPTIPAAEYDAVLWSPQTGEAFIGFEDLFVNQSAYPSMNALREQYAITPHPGVQVNVTQTLGETFTKETTHILPHLSLHASGGPLTEPHVYGRQVAAQVYSTNYATQEIYDDLVGVATSYPQVRFVARRFGSDSGTLTLTGTGSLSASSVSITSTDFDGLPEIIDGWREVTLRFATPPTMGTLASPDPSWQWRAPTATAGTRWEVLGAAAPALSGIPGNLYNLVPTPNQLYTATYQPPAGSTVELTWMPQGVASPWVSGATADQASDAFLIFSEDPPTVTGVGVTTLSQIVSGIGLDCGTSPCCIPTGVYYNRITWSPISGAVLPTSGFGAYELQRWDQVTDWQTIMSASSPAITGFSDFEARVGLQSVYRVRATNLYDFAGAWSTQVTGTVTSPGAAGCNVDGGVLIFTTNEDQTGASNLAYSPGWERGGGEEIFDFPEADQVTFQRMYGRDGSVAFHGTERGLEHFVRLLVIQQAAISPIRLANLRSLRDLAWDDLAYVCVRDDIGDRWLANVRVPAERVHQRALYMATVDITELTQTANPVDPAG